ncbi:MAG: hypothetical protein H6658_21095 [Ardenticatenaceae bacterium]|nr:hypothetical protein [Ardenticatenaceae bacterium]
MNHTRATIISFWSLFILLFIVFLGVSTNVTQASDEGDTVLSPDESLLYDAGNYSERYNVTISEAVDRLQLQKEIGDLDAALFAASPDIYTGLWIEHSPSYKVVIRYVDLVRGADILDATVDNELVRFIELREAKYPLSTLEANLNEAYLSLMQEGVFVNGNVNVFDNVGEIHALDEAVVNDVLQSVKLLDNPSLRIVKVDRLALEESSIYAGVVANACTSGYNLVKSGVTYASTAGHCSNASFSYGGYSFSYNTGYDSGKYDFQVHNIPSGVTPQPWAKTSGTYRTITGIVAYTSQPIGATVCHYGQATGYSCGEISSKIYCHSWSCSYVVVIGAVSGGGDSGGPWYSSSNAWGMHVGSTGGGDRFYMAIDRVGDKGYSVQTN